MQQYTEINP